MNTLKVGKESPLTVIRLDDLSFKNDSDIDYVQDQMDRASKGTGYSPKLEHEDGGGFVLSIYPEAKMSIQDFMKKTPMKNIIKRLQDFNNK